MKFTHIEDAKRILARHVVHRGGISELSLVDISTGKLMVYPFDMEIASTVFVDGCAVCLRNSFAAKEVLVECMHICKKFDIESIYRLLLQKDALGSISDPSAGISLFQIS